MRGNGNQPNAGTAAAVPAFGVRGFRSPARPGQTGWMRRTRAAGRRAVVIVLLAGAGLLLGAGTAAADLVLIPDQVDPGAREVTLTFRITEDDPAARPARLQVFLPTGRPLVGVRAPAPPGWAARLTTTTLPTPAPSPDGPVTEIVTGVEWTAATPPPSIVELPMLVEVMPGGAGPVRFRVGADRRRRADRGVVEHLDRGRAEAGP